MAKRRRMGFLRIMAAVWLTLFASPLFGAPIEEVGGVFLLRIHLVDMNILDPVKEFALVHLQAGPVNKAAGNVSQRVLTVLLPERVKNTVNLRVVAKDGRVAYDSRTIYYDYDEDPDHDGLYDLVMVLNFQPPLDEEEVRPPQPAGEKDKAAKSPEPERGSEGRRKEEGPSFEGLELTPTGNDGYPEEVVEDGEKPVADEPVAEDNPWTESVREAGDPEGTNGGMTPTDEPVKIPPEKIISLEYEQWHDIPAGERRIILSGYELTSGDPDNWAVPAVIDPAHVVVAVQYPNGESRVLDGEAAIAVMRQRGFLEAGGYALTPRGRKGWERPYQEAEEPDTAGDDEGQAERVAGILSGSGQIPFPFAKLGSDARVLKRKGALQMTLKIDPATGEVTGRLKGSLFIRIKYGVNTKNPYISVTRQQLNGTLRGRVTAERRNTTGRLQGTYECVVTSEIDGRNYRHNLAEKMRGSFSSDRAKVEILLGEDGWLKFDIGLQKESGQ